MAGLPRLARTAGGGGVMSNRRQGTGAWCILHRAWDGKCKGQGASRAVVRLAVMVLFLGLVGCGAQERLVLPWGQAIGGLVVVPAGAGCGRCNEYCFFFCEGSRSCRILLYFIGERG